MGKGKVKDSSSGNKSGSANSANNQTDHCSIELTSTCANSDGGGSVSASVVICECGGDDTGENQPTDCLHNAAKHGDADEIKYLLEKGADANSIDKGGRTGLHWISAVECSCDSCTENAEECMKYFLFGSYGTNIDVQDAKGDTPLHLAIEYQNVKCANLLVSIGASVSLVNSHGKDPLSRMAKKAPEVMVSVMDRAITVDKLNPNNEKCVLKMDFGAVVGYPLQTSAWASSPHHSHKKNSVNREMTLFTHIVDSSKASQKTILSHPLAAIFLNEKWKRVRKYFILFFSCYVFWLLSYTSYIIKVYLVSCPCEYFSKMTANKKAQEMASGTATPSSSSPPQGADLTSSFNDWLREKAGLAINPSILQNDSAAMAGPQSPTATTSPTADRCHLEIGFTLDVAFILFLTAIMVLNELFKIFIAPKLYFKNKLNFANWILIVMVVVTTGPVIMVPNSKPAQWQYEAAALAIFFSWAFLLTQLGTFPYLGRYVEILGHVLKNFAVSMLTFSSLLVAFALSFNVLFPGEDEAFSHFFYAMLKVLVMMTGEVDYQDMFYDKENDETRGPIVGHILYAAFVIIVAIVLMNLLIGLTVSDIQTLQKEAEFTRLSRQIVDIYRLESFFFSKKLKPKFFDLLRTSISVLHPPSGSSSSGKNKNGAADVTDSSCFRFRPNDRKDHSVPEHLKPQVLKLAIKNYHAGIGSTCGGTVKSSTRSLRSKNTISLTSRD